MTGIMLEAVVIELVIILLGNNLLSIMLAGILSVSSALFHKVLSLLILYGFDLIQIYVNMINFALKQFGLEEAGEWQILVALLSVYTFFGMMAASVGFYIGRKAVRTKNEPGTHALEVKEIQQRDFFEIKEDQHTSIPFLLVHIISIPFGLFMLNFWSLEIGLPFIIFYSLVFGYWYRFSLRRLRKPIFWSQLIIIVLLSAIFWDINKPDANWISREGFLVGIEMMIRALFIVIAFSALSVELRNQKVKDFLFGIGFGQFYQAVGMAFSSLPIMISSLPNSKKIIKNPFRSFVMPLVMADCWLQLFEQHQ
jgi:hypothetical protein